MKTTKKITMNLRCNLTDPEKLAAGKELAEATNALQEIENDKARIMADFKAKISAEEAHVSIVSNKVRSGYEFRDVTCLVHYDTPETGKKQTIRQDTGEVVATADMSESEKQQELSLEEPEASETSPPE